jgi:hypothetical protein
VLVEVVVEEARLAALLEAEVLPVVVALLAAVAVDAVVETVAEVAAVVVDAVAETVAEEGKHSIILEEICMISCAKVLCATLLTGFLQ